MLIIICICILVYAHNWRSIFQDSTTKNGWVNGYDEEFHVKCYICVCMYVYAYISVYVLIYTIIACKNIFYAVL